MTRSTVSQLDAPDGRLIEVLTGGDEQGFPLLFHYGTPSAVVPYGPLDDICEALGLRLVSYSRPGYGGSTPRATAGRIVDDVGDMVTVIDALDLGDFVTLGWSGGGPRALAAAARLPGPCRAAATLAGVAPFNAAGLAWDAGMAPENVEDFRAAVQGADAYHALLELTLPPMFAATPDEIVSAFGELVTSVDAAALTGEFAELMSASLTRAGAQGVVGARDDGLAIVAPWGFEVADITVPVAVWQGRQDAMVPFEHGVWLADNIPTARAHLYEDEGHLTLVNQMDRILADLKALAGL